MFCQCFANVWRSSQSYFGVYLLIRRWVSEDLEERSIVSFIICVV